MYRINHVTALTVAACAVTSLIAIPVMAQRRDFLSR